MGRWRSVEGFELGNSGLMGLHINHYAIEEDYVMFRKVSNLMPLPCMTSAGKRSSQKTTRSNRMKFRLIETGLLTVKNNVNAFHGNERTYGQYKTRTADCGLRTADCGLRTADYGLRTGYKIRTRYKTRTGKYGLGIKHGLGIKRGLRTADWV